MEMSDFNLGSLLLTEGGYLPCSSLISSADGFTLGENRVKFIPVIFRQQIWRQSGKGCFSQMLMCVKKLKQAGILNYPHTRLYLF